MKEIIKQYLKHGIDKVFFLSISFKCHVFLIVTAITSWLVALGLLDSSAYALIMTTLITAVVAGREYSKNTYNKSE